MDMAFSLLEVFASFDNVPDPPISWGSSSYTMADFKSQNLQGTQVARSLLWSRTEAARLPFFLPVGEGHLWEDLSPLPFFHREMRYKDTVLDKGCPCVPCMCQLHQSAQHTSEVPIKSNPCKTDLVTLVDFPKNDNAAKQHSSASNASDF